MPQGNTANSPEEKREELTNTQYLVETIKRLQTEKEALRLALVKARRIPSGKIGAALLIPGILSLAYSIYSESSTLAFIGLGLTFWGALFFFARPIKYVRSTLLDSTVHATYTTIDRILKDLKYTGKSYYVPPYPKEVYLPEHLKGLKEMIVFISANKGNTTPSIEEMAQEKFLLQQPKGIGIAPPGLGLLTLFKEELKTELTTLTLDELCDTLQKTILENFQLAKDIQIQPQQNQIHITITDSTYKDLYSKQQNLRSVHTLGDPTISAITCAIAQNTGKMVTIQKTQTTLDNQTIQAWLQIHGEQQ
jgi:hypothetical protein